MLISISDFGVSTVPLLLIGDVVKFDEVVLNSFFIVFAMHDARIYSHTDRQNMMEPQKSYYIASKKDCIWYIKVLDILLK